MTTEIEKKLTPVSKVIDAFEKSLVKMPDCEIKNAIKICKEIAELILDYEQSCIKDAFNEGEMNVWNHERDQCFEFEGGTDYFNKNFITNPNE